MLIGIDGSTTATGFAFGGVNDGAPKGGTWKLPGASEEVFDLTLARVSDSVASLARLIRAERICIEAPLLLADAEHSAHTAMALIQLTGAIRSAAKRAGCEVTLTAVSTVRKHFINHGRLPRVEAKLAVQARCKLLGWSFVDGDHADANAVWCWGMSHFYKSWSPQGTPLFAARAGV